MKKSRTMVSGDDLSKVLSQEMIGGLDFLRAVAVLLVVVGHISEGAGKYIPLLGDASGIGVGIFFVISGFLINHLLMNEFERTGGLNIGSFYRRRCARLLPVFFLYVAVVVSVRIMKGQPVPWDAVVAALFYFINYHQAWTGAESNIVSHCWSLAVEEQFYFLWPMILVLLMKARRSVAHFLICGIALVWIWRVIVVLSGGSEAYLYRALETRADGFLTGCLLSVLLRQRKNMEIFSGLMNLPFLTGGLIIALVLCIHGERYSVGVRYGVIMMIEQPLMALILLRTMLASNQGGVSGLLVNHPVMVLVGRTSYGIYLFHGLIGYTAMMAVMRLSDGNFPVSLACVLIVLVLTMWAVLRWFETPARRWLAGPATVHPPVDLPSAGVARLPIRAAV
jgi:peptidoglycan/LPS O-acetylase OafA/YrhL